ncbi:hypothetical protein BC629DRAFT_920232 [Irpex lacteus]|nr:hypothetical protein BC629DRAFT_920232 [Irpex lacteus]
MLLDIHSQYGRQRPCTDPFHFRPLSFHLQVHRLMLLNEVMLTSNPPPHPPLSPSLSLLRHGSSERRHRNRLVWLHRLREVERDSQVDQGCPSTSPGSSRLLCRHTRTSLQATSIQHTRRRIFGRRARMLRVALREVAAVSARRGYGLKKVVAQPSEIDAGGSSRPEVRLRKWFLSKGDLEDVSKKMKDL